MSEFIHESSSDSEGSREVAFDSLKSNFHRVVLVTGAHGGPTPNGRFMHMAVYYSDTYYLYPHK